jgi:uncharacterized DUF497 family protein
MPNWRYPQFDWDDGNIDHIVDGHDVYPEEVESVFANGAHITKRGNRYIAMGRDIGGRYLYIVCEIHGQFVRVVTARPMKPAEKRTYERNR